jgi:protein TonB
MKAFLQRVLNRISAQRISLRDSRHASKFLSVAAHLALLACLVGGVRQSPQIQPYRLPGTALGNTALVFYAPGSSRPTASNTALKPRDTPKSALMPKPKPSPPAEAPTPSSQTNAGKASAVESGLGEGDIQIALETYFPYPKPDLSGLPHGTKGDVILDAVIDEHGKISELTLLKGLGSPVDESVIATVQQWQYTPAMKNGVPVASERELHFHYERS